MASTRTPAAAAAATNLCPGSDTDGVPASVRSATFLPLARSVRSSWARSASLPSKYETTRGPEMPR